MAMIVKEDNNEVCTQWRVTDIKVPTSEIKNITQDQDIRAAPKLDSKDASRVGPTLSKTNHVIIDTEDHEYIIYTQNDQEIYNELTK